MNKNNFKITTNVIIIFIVKPNWLPLLSSNNSLDSIFEGHGFKYCFRSTYIWNFLWELFFIPTTQEGIWKKLVQCLDIFSEIHCNKYFSVPKTRKQKLLYWWLSISVWRELIIGLFVWLYIVLLITAIFH